MAPAHLLAFLMTTHTNISVTDFGAKPNSRDDTTASIARAIASLPPAGGTVEFPTGEYHFYRENAFDRELWLSNTEVANPRRISILLEGLKGVRLKGNGSKLVFHDRVIPFAILNSKNISIDGFTVDWGRPLMSQGTVLASGRDGFTLKIDRKLYPYVVEDGALYFTDRTWKRKPWAFMEFDPRTKGVAYNTGDQGFTDGDVSSARVSELLPDKVRFDFACKRYPRVGDVLVARHGVRDHAGTFILGSKNVSLSHVNYRHTSGLGVLSQYSADLKFQYVEVAEDPKSTRMFAGHDDGFHFSNCRGDILVDRCRFEGLMDDPINVHGTAVKVIERLGSHSLRCRFMHNQSVGLMFGTVGDVVSFIDHETMLSRGVGNLTGVNHLSAEEIEVTFKEDLPDGLKVGDALEDLTWTPNFTVRHTEFGCVRARGLLISTPGKVVVEDCLFRSSGAAILIAGDANYWYESGAVTDVTIRRNRFVNCNTSPYQFGDAVISIHPEIPTMGSRPFHRGIKIEGNLFQTFDAPLLWAQSTGDLTFRNNEIQATLAFPPRSANAPGLTFIGCENVQVAANRLDPKFLGRLTRIEGGKPKTVSIEGWR
jgi:hypothetical protein